jgi:hypothetical protein
MAGFVVDEKKITKPVMVAFSKDSTIRDIAAGIRDLRYENKWIEENPSLREAALRLLDLLGTNFKKFENWEEVVRFLESQPNLSQSIGEIEAGPNHRKK